MGKAHTGLKALVVDDVPAIRSHLVGLLEEQGIGCLEARNGIEAMERLEEEAFDLVFTDLVMPEMDGFELCEEIRRRPRHCGVPLIVTSSHRDAAYVMRALRRGADDYLTKPTSAQLVERVVARVRADV